MKKIGERLKHERERLDISAAKMAEIGGVVRTVQYNYEKNVSKPDAEYLAKISEIGVDILYVITGQRTPKGDAPLGDDEARLVKNYNRVGDNEKAAAQQLLSTLAAGKKRAA